jgi:integrase/recombinase XerD
MSRSNIASPVPAEELLEGFVGYLRRERGLRERSVEAYVWDVGRFLAQVGDRDLRALTAADVSAVALIELDGGRAPATVRRFACALRSFLRYCVVFGVVEHDLSSAVLPVSGRRRSLLPKGVTSSQAATLLAGCDRGSSTGRRDYAVLVVILRLGLRASEVATLRLDHIDWRAGQLMVRGKGGRVDELPLPTDVGAAIAAYLRDGRPRDATAREVFLRVQPPAAAMTRAGVTHIVEAASRRAGIEVVRAHRLRHTAATDMLGHGAALAEIGQVLRHGSPGSTAVYARVDVARLRTIARPWPKGMEW